MSESAVNSTDVVPQDCCNCIAWGQALRPFSSRCGGSDKHSAELAIVSCSSDGLTMIVLEHSNKSFTEGELGHGHACNSIVIRISSMVRLLFVP